MKKIAILVFALIGFASPVLAQDRSGPALSSCETQPTLSNDCLISLYAWVQKEYDWQVWMMYWGNHASLPNPKYALKKRDRQQPPAWVFNRCNEVVKDPTVALDEACKYYADYLKYDWTLDVREYEPTPIVFKQILKVKSTSGEHESIQEWFLKNMHLDGIWTNSSTGPRTYGFVGAHMTFAYQGRVYLWGSPGVILVRDTDGRVRGKHTYGFDVILGSVKLPGRINKVKIYLTAAKVFASANSNNPIEGANSGINMMGLSMTVR